MQPRDRALRSPTVRGTRCAFVMFPPVVSSAQRDSIWRSNSTDYTSYKRWVFPMRQQLYVTCRNCINMSDTELWFKTITPTKMKSTTTIVLPDNTLILSLLVNTTKNLVVGLSYRCGGKKTVLVGHRRQRERCAIARCDRSSSLPQTNF